jgi:hypothetical protein
MVRLDDGDGPGGGPLKGQAVLDRAEFPGLAVAGAERRRLAAETLRRIVAELEALGHKKRRS